MDTFDRIKQFDTAIRKYISKDFRDWLVQNGFFVAPASTKYHGNYMGGLFDHSFAVMQILLQLSINNKLRWKREASPFIVGMFHDLCKIDQYEPDEEGDGYHFNKDTLYCGHGDKSIMLLGSHIQLTDEEAACIRYHMGAFTDKEEWSYYTRAVNTFENVLWTHTADMLASHVYGK